MEPRYFTIENLVERLNGLKKMYPPKTDMIAMLLSAAEYIEVTRIMDFIGNGMREIPQLPSEIALDKDRLVKAEFPETGGVYTYMQNHPYPYRGFPLADFVDRIDFIKKVSRGAISGIYHSFKRRNKFLLLTLLPSLWALKDFVHSAIYTFARLTDRFKLKPIRFSEPMRELYRAFSLPVSRETDELRENLRILACMFMEFDNAYRFRFQDVVSELDKGNLLKHPTKEIIRLLDLMASRETTQEIRDSWKLAKYAVKFYLVFDRKMLKIIVNALSNLDLAKIALSPEDRHFCEKRKDYVFGFQKAEQSKLEINNNVPCILNERRECGLQV